MSKIRSRLSILFCLLMCFSLMESNGQNENVWAFANYRGVDFNTVPPTLIQTSIDYGINSGESAATVCDNNGQLLFYTDGSRVWDRNHALMPNGNDLTGFGSGVTGSTSQGALIVPWPDSVRKYFVFSLLPMEEGDDLGKLFYSVVDMNLNGGTGDIISEQKGILIDSNLTEKMTATVGDRCNIWLVVRSRLTPSPVMKSYEITEEGINLIPVVSPTTSTGQYIIGKMQFSPNGQKLAETSILGSNGLTLYDFDVSTGIVSNDVQLVGDVSTWGVAFSPDNTKLYYAQSVSAAGTVPDGKIWQIDISLGTTAFITPCYGITSIKLAADGKLYFFDTDSSLAYLGLPNLSGAATNLVLNAIPANGHGLGLPHILPVIKKDTSCQVFWDTATCFATALQLSAADTTGWGYYWNTGNAGMHASVASPGTYRLTYRTSPCVIHVDTYHVWFPATAQNISIEAACNSWANGKAWVSGEDTFITYSYKWTESGDTTVLSITDSLLQVPPGAYQVEISTSSGCNVTLQVYIPTEEYRVSFDSDTLFCISDTVSFQNTSPNYFTNWEWSFGDTGSSLLEDPRHSYTHPGYYEVKLLGIGEKCTDTAYRHITIDTPLVDLGFSKNKEAICMGESIIFMPQSDSTVVSLLWDYGDGSSLTAAAELMQHAYDKAGIMQVQLTTQFRACPSFTFTDTLHVHPFPLVNLGPDSALCLDGKSIALYNRQPYYPGYTYLWSTGDTTQIIEAVNRGAYSLTVTNQYGCATQESVMIDKDCYIDIPNAYTPNSDGTNDYFFPRQLLTKGVATFSMQIFNRWGQIIFETKETDGRGWDGKFNGIEQPIGVYIYLVDLSFDNGRTEHYEGNVTLLR